MPILNVFLDEAGNFDFSDGGTEWLVLTSVCTSDPAEGVGSLYEVKHRLIASGYEIECFHATEDKQPVRDQVFAVLASLQRARVDAVAIRKRRLNPNWRKPEEFYPRMLDYLLGYTFARKGVDATRYDRVHVFMDRVSATRRQKEAILGGVKKFLARRLEGVPYLVMMHQSAAHLYLQMADYCCWAMYVKWERGEVRPYEVIQHLIASDFDIFQNGHTDWY